MKFELKTENDNKINSFSNIFKIVFFLALIIFICDVSYKLGIISRHYQIDHNCKLLSVEKSQIKFEKLLRLSNLKDKKKIWEFCRNFVK